jgi:hypothetical protein
MAYSTAPVFKAGQKSMLQFSKAWAKGLFEGVKHEFPFLKSNIAEMYIKEGGGFGYIGEIMRDPKIAKSRLFKPSIGHLGLDVIKSPVSFMDKISSSVELAPRLGIFNEAIKANYSGADAAMMARASTIDFNRAGTWMRVANQWIPFLNARVQARVSLADALRTNPYQTSAKIFASTVVPGVTLYAWNRLYFSDLYDDIPEYIKSNYFTFIIGSKMDRGRKVPEYFVVPKGDIGQISMNPIEFAFDQEWKNNPKNVVPFLVNYLSDLSPVDFAREGKISPSKALGSITPPVLKGVIEGITNFNLYRGFQIVPEYMKKTLPSELQKRDNTPELYIKIGKKTGVSPLQIQNFAGNIFASYGREGLDGGAMLRGLTGRIYKIKGGEIERRAWVAIGDMEKGYKTSRALAVEAVMEGRKEDALRIMRMWNSGFFGQINAYNREFEKYGYGDRTGLIRSYTFTPTKVGNVLKSRPSTLSYIEKRLLPPQAGRY